MLLLLVTDLFRCYITLLHALRASWRIILTPVNILQNPQTNLSIDWWRINIKKLDVPLESTSLGINARYLARPCYD